MYYPSDSDHGPQGVDVIDSAKEGQVHCMGQLVWCRCPVIASKAASLRWSVGQRIHAFSPFGRPIKDPVEILGSRFV